MEHSLLKQAVAELVGVWSRDGLPGRGELVHTAARLKETAGGIGLWPEAPQMLLATLDDGIGQGIDLIGRFAEAVGVQVDVLGLLQPPEKIIAESRRRRPHLLGLTVLQLDSESDLTRIARELPPETRLVAGGPAFRIDPDLANRAGVHVVAKDLAAFLFFILEFVP